MAAPRPTLAYKPIPDSAHQALAHYREHQLLIEASLAKLRPDLLKETWFATANRELARNIVTALKLGDMDLLDDEIAWLEGMGSGNQVPAEVLEDFLRLYHRAVAIHLDERGTLITAWLSRWTNANGIT